MICDCEISNPSVNPTTVLAPVGLLPRRSHEEATDRARTAGSNEKVHESDTIPTNLQCYRRRSDHLLALFLHELVEGLARTLTQSSNQKESLVTCHTELLCSYWSRVTRKCALSGNR